MSEQANSNVVVNKAPAQDQEISILQLLSIIRHRKIWVILWTILAVALAVAYLYVTVPTYEATSTALVDPISSNASSIESLLSTSTSSSNIATEVELVTSNKTLNNALALLDLNNYLDADGIPYSEKDWEKIDLSKKVSVSTVNSTKVVSITVTDQNPQFCADYANAIAQSYTSLLTGIAKNSKSAQREFLEEQIPITEALLEEATDELAAYQETSGVIQMTEKSSILTKSIANYQMMTEPLKLQLIEDETIINTLYEQLEGLPSLAEVSENAQIKELLEEYEANDTELVMYSSLDENANTSRVYVLESAISAKEKSILEIVNSLGSTTSSTYSKAITDYLCVNSQISVLEKMEEMANEELSEYPQMERELDELKRDVEIYQSLSLKLREMLEEAKMLEAAVVGNVTVVDEATVPTVAVKPKKMMILAASVVVGAVIGVLFAFLLAMLDNTIQSEDDIKQIVGNSVPMLGWTYYLKSMRSIKREVPGLVVLNSPDSMFAERFVSIANNIVYSTPKKIQVLSINSTEMNEGKTSVVCNVAAAYAMAGKKVLIIDADFRKPAIEHFFNLIPSKLGLVDSVIANVPLEQCIIKAVKELPNLHILPPGRGTRNPNALYSSAEFAEVLRKLRKVYDYVLIDSPPLSYGSEFTNLAKNLDGFVLDVRAGVSTKNALYGFAQSLCFLQVPVLGYILYGVIPSNHSAHGIGTSGYYGYGGYSSYGKNKNYYYQKKSASDTLYEQGSGSYKRIYQNELKIREKHYAERKGFPMKKAQLAYAPGAIKTAEAVKTEAKPEAKPAETKPAESVKPAVKPEVKATKPATPAKPASSAKPATTTKPAATTKPAKPVDKTMDMLSEIEADYQKKTK